MKNATVLLTILRHTSKIEMPPNLARAKATHRRAQICEGRLAGKVDEMPGGCSGLIKKVMLLQIARDRNRLCKSRRDAHRGEEDRTKATKEEEEEMSTGRVAARVSFESTRQLVTGAPGHRPVQIYLPVRNPLHGPGTWAGGGVLGCLEGDGG